MNPATHQQFQAQVCNVIRQLGQALDGFATAAECNRLPGDRAVDALVTLQHLDEAACAVESATTLMNDLAVAIDRECEAAKTAAAPLIGGAS